MTGKSAYDITTQDDVQLNTDVCCMLRVNVCCINVCHFEPSVVDE